MRILFGVCGEGFGHGAIASGAVSFLESRGHEVVVVTYDQGYEMLKDRFDVFRVEGLHSIYDEGVLNYRKTASFNAKNFLRNVGKRKELKRLMESFKPDICMSDIEPIVPILSYLYRKPLISVSMVNTFGNFDMPIPSGHWKHYFISRMVRRLIVPKANHKIAISLFDLKSRGNGVSLVLPGVRQDITELKPGNGNYVLVYLSKESNRVLSILEQIDENFVIYGYNVNSDKDNLIFRKKDSFLRTLENCKAVISTAGFVLMSEAIYLKKPFFAFPLKGQFEQMFNACVLRESGFGEYSEKPSLHDILDFLSNLGTYRENLFGYHADPELFYKELEKVLVRTITLRK